MLYKMGGTKHRLAASGAHLSHYVTGSCIFPPGEAAYLLGRRFEAAPGDLAHEKLPTPLGTVIGP